MNTMEKCADQMTADVPQDIVESVANSVLSVLLSSVSSISRFTLLFVLFHLC